MQYFDFFIVATVSLFGSEIRAFSFGSSIITSPLKSKQYSRFKTSRLASSLTDDGDFALLGLNTDAEPADLSETVASAASSYSAQASNTDTSIKTESFSEEISTDPETPQTYQQDQNQSSLLDGLTEDGDFVLEGVNAIDPSANQALEKYGSPLVTEDADRDANTLLSQHSLNQDTTTYSKSSMSDQQNILGLTDGGDLAMVGLNTATTADGVADNNIASTVVLTNTDDRDSYTTTITTKERLKNGPHELEEVMAWLLNTIPTLSTEVCTFYAHKLVSLGLHPECVTQCELQMDDLTFMKPLHQRYLYNEVTGDPHPWEP